ncbi:MAG: hypothetical protein KBG20_07260 [Caldilineaceae bacterium]|nr:hypothetical protein [Caldilineaceae bacterium]MBP8108677.1 hypothetical protein [Caldilineaceae bacterium]MBP8122807.1 hypothetical protein [Caldilineaceae bacterium]MBP9072078.1 hypothetical protein [Caldilineaceae bacterium]
MNNLLMKAQSKLVYGVEIVSVALFVLYLGFMTHYYILFYDGTAEMYEFYKKLQVFNKEAFSLAIIFVVLAVALLVFELHKSRPGWVGLALVIGTTAFVSMQSISLINVIPKYKQGYLALDFSTLNNYVPSTFVFDAGLVLHSILIGLLAIFTVVAILTFVQRLKDRNPITGD